MCEMVREAQTRDTPFYMDESNEDCMGGAMGMVPDEPMRGDSRGDGLFDGGDVRIEGDPGFPVLVAVLVPQLTGKVNYLVMGTGHGTTARETYEPGSILVSVPSPWFPIILENLGRMERVPHAWEIGRKAWLKEGGRYTKTLFTILGQGIDRPFGRRWPIYRNELADGRVLRYNPQGAIGDCARKRYGFCASHT